MVSGRSFASLSGGLRRSLLVLALLIAGCGGNDCPSDAYVDLIIPSPIFGDGYVHQCVPLCSAPDAGTCPVPMRCVAFNDGGVCHP